MWAEQAKKSCSSSSHADRRLKENQHSIPSWFCLLAKKIVRHCSCEHMYILLKHMRFASTGFISKGLILQEKSILPGIEYKWYQCENESHLPGHHETSHNENHPHSQQWQDYHGWQKHKLCNQMLVQYNQSEVPSAKDIVKFSSSAG